MLSKKPSSDRHLNLLLALSLLFLADGSAWAGKFATYEECILESMKGVSSDYAAAQITQACRSQFSGGSPKSFEISDLDKLANTRVNIKYYESDLARAISHDYMKNCGEAGCGMLKFLNQSGFDVKKVLLTVRFKTSSGLAEEQYYAEPSSFARCAPHQSCEFSFPIEDRIGDGEGYWIDRVWGSLPQ